MVFFLYTCIGQLETRGRLVPRLNLVTVNISLVIDSNGDGMEKGGRKVVFVWRIDVNIW